MFDARYMRKAAFEQRLLMQDIDRDNKNKANKDKQERAQANREKLQEQRKAKAKELYTTVLMKSLEEYE